MIWADTITGTHDKNHPTVPVSIGQKPADLDGVVARTAYTTTHMMTWKEKVSGYLVTKAIAAGVMLVAALLVLLGHAAEQAAVGVVPPMVAGVFLGITGVLLIADLKQPTRFHYLLTRGNTDSWLVKGAYVLMFFAAMCGLWWDGCFTENDGLIEIVAIPAALGALGTAGYTAYLFAQCEGRDLWQTPLLLPVLLAQAVTAGGATYAVLDVFMDLPEQNAIAWVLLGGVVATGAFVWMELASHGEPPCRARRRDDDPRPVRPTVLGRWDHGRAGRTGASRSSCSPPTSRAPPRLPPPASLRSPASSPTRTPSSGPASPSLSPDRLLAES